MLIIVVAVRRKWNSGRCPVSSKMFWRFGFHQASPLEAILEKESFTLQELLEEEDVLQECKALNRKLVELYAPA